MNNRQTSFYDEMQKHNEEKHDFDKKTARIVLVAHVVGFMIPFAIKGFMCAFQ